MYSVSSIILVMALLWASLGLPDLGNNVNPTTRVGSAAMGKIKPMGSWSGSWPGNSGYHNYGWITFDGSGIPTGNAVTISWTVYDVPNRFTISDDCGLGIQNFTDWQGTASYPGPWGNAIGNNTSGNISVLKQAGCSSYKFLVETSTGSSLGDGWAVSH